MDKAELRRFLFTSGENELKKMGFKPERIQRFRKSSVRQIIKDGKVKKVAIKTSQDTWIAFMRNSDDNGWDTLDDVDYVLVASVDSRFDPEFARIHFVDANEMRRRFDKAYEARTRASHKLTPGRGTWISLYDAEKSDPVVLVGAGIGIVSKAIATIPLPARGGSTETHVEKLADIAEDERVDEKPLTISAAKRLLALSLGVDVNDIKITIST